MLQDVGVVVNALSSDVYSRPNVSKVVGFREERPRVGLRKSGDPEAQRQRTTARVIPADGQIGGHDKWRRVRHGSFARDECLLLL